MLMMVSPPRKNPQPYKRHFFKEWREFRGLTQEEAADQMGIMDRTNLSRLERGQAPYGQKALEAAARVYSCKPWDILNVNPLMQGEPVDRSDLGDLGELFTDATPEQRAELLGYARGLVRRQRH